MTIVKTAGTGGDVGGHAGTLPPTSSGKVECVFLGNAKLTPEAVGVQVSSLDPPGDGLRRHADVVSDLTHGKEPGQARGGIRHVVNSGVAPAMIAGLSIPGV